MSRDQGNAERLRRRALAAVATLVLALTVAAWLSFPSGRVASAAAPPSGQLAVVANGYTRPQPTPRLALYSTRGRALAALVVGRPHPESVGFSGPAWSPDGQRLFFTQSSGRYDRDIYAIDISTRRVTRLTRTGDAVGPVLSPDGAAIAFARAEGPEARRIASGMWLMRSDGAAERRLLPVRKGWHDLPGSWSPDGTRLAFTRCPPAPARFPPDGLFSNTCAIYELELATKKLRKLAARALWPAYSPDGASLAFVSDRDTNGKVSKDEDSYSYAHELYLAAADGTGARRMTETEGVDEQTSTWSPDSRFIAYARRIQGSELVVLEVADPKPTVIAGHAGSGGMPRGWPGSIGQPAWRP